MPRNDREERVDSHFTCVYQNSVTDPSSDVQSNVAPPQTSTTEPTGNALHSFLRGLGMSDRSVSCMLYTYFMNNQFAIHHFSYMLFRVKAYRKLNIGRDLNEESLFTFFSSPLGQTAVSGNSTLHQ